MYSSCKHSPKDFGSGYAAGAWGGGGGFSNKNTVEWSYVQWIIHCVPQVLVHCFILVALPQTENKANSIVKAVKAHVEYTNEVSMCSYACHHSGSISYPFGYITLHCGQGKVGVVTCSVLCTWRLISLAVKGPWLALGGPILTLRSYMNGLRKCYSHLIRGSLLARKAVWFLNASWECWLLLAYQWVAVVKVTGLLIVPESALGFSFGARNPTEMVY